MPEVADVLRRSGADYRARCGEALLPRHRRTMDDLLPCRTAALGGPLWQGAHWGQAPYVYPSCRTRSGPTGHRLATATWREERRRARLPVPDCHVVFPLPQARRELVRRHQNDRYDLFLRAAAPARIQLAADPHYVGGLIGRLCVLHTWPRPLAYHPHVHCLVPAGGGSADRTEWRPARPSSLGPVHALAQLFRGLCLNLGRQERPDLPLPAAVWTKGWGVYGTPAVHGTEPVLPSLGRDVHRMALTNRRSLSLANEQVCCRSQASQPSRWHTMPRPAQELIRRVLPHVLPQGFPKVRSYGLWSPVQRPLLPHLQRWLAAHSPPAPLEAPARERQSARSPYGPLQAGPRCPSCGQG